MEKEPQLEKQPQEFRLVLLRDFQQETDDLFVEGSFEPEKNDVMWIGSLVDPKASEIWDEAGITTPLDEDKYMIQTRDEDGSWLFMGFFSTPDDLQWVLETVRGDAALQE